MSTDNHHHPETPESKNDAVARAFEEALDDVHTRFVLNLPEEELATSDRIFFQLEQAYWFYDDFHCDNSELPLPRFKSLKPFAKKLFAMSPLLPLAEFDRMWEEFSLYKRKISTYGTILMNEACTKVVLCRVYKGKSWTFPAGKVNQNERGIDAGARETYEETGFDPNRQLGQTRLMKDVPWKHPLQEEDGLVFMDTAGKRRTLYVCRGVPEDFPFAPVARKEVSDVQWHSIHDLPKKSFCVLPFVKQLRQWTKKQQRTHTPKRSTSSKKRSRNNSRGRVVREDDPLIRTGLASPGDRERWTEEEMFRANEILSGRKITYDGNPHVFAEKGFDGGKDPHQFHVVGGSFMNTAVGGATIAPPPDQSLLQPLFRKDGESGGENELQPFFSDSGATPWGQVVDEVAPLKPWEDEMIVVQQKAKKSVGVIGGFMTDAEVTAKSQRTKRDHKSQQRQRAESQRRYQDNIRHVKEWVRNLPDPPPTPRFGTFRFDVDTIMNAMHQTMSPSRVS